MKNQEIEQDICDMMLCGTMYFSFQCMFYKLKDAILETYGTYDGVDHQTWVEYNMYDDYGDNDENRLVWAEHHHLLDRYIYGGHLFHIPTNEFFYFNYGYQTSKISDNYNELRKVAKNTIEGKKKKRYGARKEAWLAFKRLIRRHGHLLKKQPVITL